MVTPKKAVTVAKASLSGDHLTLLKSLRKRCADKIDDPDCPARDLASLSRRVQDLSKDITAIEERLQQEDREQNPCTHCGGTGVNRHEKASAATNDGWRPT